MNEGDSRKGILKVGQGRQAVAIMCDSVGAYEDDVACIRGSIFKILTCVYYTAFHRPMLFILIYFYTSSRC